MHILNFTYFNLQRYMKPHFIKAEVAAAASLAVMKSVEYNDNIHANGSRSLSGSFRSLRKGRPNAKSNQPETPSALSLNSMRKQLKAKDMETEQKLKTFEDEELRHRPWEKKVKERELREEAELRRRRSSNMP